ncbi:MAG TPA: ATP-dependent sacrificial sulfur transferase LarE [Candidatus Polarisedimenticolaceae bacterium]|nr:ATP-dependent sacrificial sulfur transferase LarE [Candidatus Polarisedimenticolaceae bacterium]
MARAVDTSIKKTAVLAGLAGRDSLVVALSGGVDSAVLLSLAVEALGPQRVLAVTGRSPAVPDREIDDARRVADSLGVRHEVLATNELQRAGYRSNAGDRCFHCRTELFEVLRAFADGRGIPDVAYGAITDDLAEFRPGMQAARQRGILAPLLEAGLNKREVRELAAAAGLPVSEKPANPCLASRIPVGTEVTPERLAQIDRAEAGLAGLGFRSFRVRHHGEVARIELDDEGRGRLSDPTLVETVVREVRAAGFRFVTLDLEGYRTGSLDPPRAVLHRIQPDRLGGQ